MTEGWGGGGEGGINFIVKKFEDEGWFGIAVMSGTRGERWKMKFCKEKRKYEVKFYCIIYSKRIVLLTR